VGIRARLARRLRAEGAFEADEFPDDAFAILGVAGGYCYLNASVMRLFGERAPGLSLKMTDEQFFGAQPGIPDYVERPGDVRPDLTDRLQETFGWVFAQANVDDLDRLTEHRERTVRLRARRPDFAAMSDQELWDEAHELFPSHREYFSEHIFASTLAIVPVRVRGADDESGRLAATRGRRRRADGGWRVDPGFPWLPGGVGRSSAGGARFARPSALEPGDVLVAPITDPPWTPLFVPAGGVVVDVGAALSHAIVVSRELGIPCVVLATDATRRIPDGALVRVDGDTGTVTVLDLPSS